MYSLPFLDKIIGVFFQRPMEGSCSVECSNFKAGSVPYFTFEEPVI